MKNTILQPVVYTGMAIIRDIPNRYLAGAFMVLTFLFFYAGGTTIGQSPFYGVLFIGIAIILFFTATYIGKKDNGPG